MNIFVLLEIKHLCLQKSILLMYSSRYVFLSILSVAPRVVARSPSVHEDGESPPIPMVTLDHALPVTSLQIWLADGRRLVQRFNLSHR